MPHLRTWVVCLFLVSHLLPGNAQQDDRPPPRYSSDRLPKTGFTCEGKFTGRYYADPETDCQMFHICSKTSRRDFSDFKFLCPNGTVFDQEHQVCADYYQVVCHYDSDTNPNGPIFEIFKLSSKESTNRREFGMAPPRKDPEYLGQNSLSNEDFQVEEYNNNKLASSRNALPFQSTPIKPLKDDILFKSTTTPEPIPSTEVIFTTPQQRQPNLTRPPPRRNSLGNAPILLKSSTLPQQSTTAVPINFSRRILHVTTAPPPPPSQSKFEKLYDRIKSRRTEAPVTFSSQRPTSPTTTPIYRPAPTTPSSKPPPSIFDDPQLRFKDFASLNKFQTQFHASFSSNPPRSTPSTTTEQASTSTFVPLVDYTEKDYALVLRYEETTTPPPPTARRIPTGFDLSLNSFSDPNPDGEDEPGFTTTQETFPEKSTTVAGNLDFNTRPRSETKPPTEFQSTRRIPIYDQTVRTTYQDLTTPGPQTFKQQPTRFGDEFFRKIDKPIDFITTDDEDDFFANAIPTDSSVVFGRNPPESSTVTTEASTTTTTSTPSTTTVRPFRRRRPEKEIQRRKNLRLAEQRLKLSRRGSSTFENRTSVTVVEKSVSGEIFNVEASVNSGSAGINNFQNNEVGRVKGDDTTTTTTTSSPRQRGSLGRRVRPSFKEGRAHDEGGHQFGRIERRGRPTTSSSSTTTTTERPDFVFATTYRPVHRIRLTTINNFTTTTTTVEPELVTASDADIARLRSKSEVMLESTTRPLLEKPIVLSLKVTSKSAYKAVSPSSTPKPVIRVSGDESDGEPPRRSADYDYSYYDSDREGGADSIIQQDAFGEKFSNV